MENDSLDECAKCDTHEGNDGQSLEKCSVCKRFADCGIEYLNEHLKGGNKCFTKHLGDVGIIKETPEIPGASIVEEQHATIHSSLGSKTTSEVISAQLNSDHKMKKIPPIAQEECANCAAVGGRNDTVLSKCSKCLLVAYCSRACQLQHWKDGGHKRFCLSPSERIPAPTTTSRSRKTKEMLDTAALQCKNDDCTICDEKMDSVNMCTLPCGHRFHSSCVMNMRQFSVSQACPLCRSPLPRESENSFDFAQREYTAIARQVMASGASWGALPALEEKRMAEVVRCVRAAGEQGYPPAQTLLGDLYLRGEGVAQNGDEGINWYRKAARQGYKIAQQKLDAVVVGGQFNSSRHKVRDADCHLVFLEGARLILLLTSYFLKCDSNHSCN